MARTPEHSAWIGMRQRCLDPKVAAYKNYGGRGIRVCDRWQESFEAFYADMGPRPTNRHSIERLNNDLGYSPENCRWATRYEQANNKRTSELWTHHGVTMTQAEWAAHLGMTRSGLWSRVHVLGWSVEKALATKRQIHRKHKNRTKREADGVSSPS